jgi:hypothetical protein
VSTFISGASAAPTFAQVNAALATADASIDLNGQKIVDATNQYGRLIASLSGNVSFAATETKTVHTITPTNNQCATYHVFWRAVPAINDGSGGGFFQYTVKLVRKSAGTVTVSATSTPVQLRINTLASASGDASASSGNLIVTFSTSGGAGTLVLCDVFEDAST